MTRKQQLQALRKAVRAKVAYWDAMNHLELAFGYASGDIPDDASDALVHAVEDFSVGMDDPTDAMTNITADDLTYLTNELEKFK